MLTRWCVAEIAARQPPPVKAFQSPAVTRIARSAYVTGEFDPSRIHSAVRTQHRLADILWHLLVTESKRAGLLNPFSLSRRARRSITSQPTLAA